LLGRIKELPHLLTIYCTGFVFALVGWFIAVVRRGNIIRNALRSRWKGLQTAIVTYYRPDDDRRVVLVGAMHVADRSYFEALKEFVDLEKRVNGSVVLYEMTRESPDPPAKDDYSAPAILERGFGRLRKVYRYMAASTGRAFQYDVLTPQEDWINTDLTRREVAERSSETWLIRFLARTGLLWAAAKLIGFVGGVPEPPDRPNFPVSLQTDNAMRGIHLSILLNALLLLLPKKATPAHIILNDRNEVAVEGILRAARNSSFIVSIWGAAHLPGIGRLLEAQGFTRSDEVKWYTCAHFRRYGILSIVRYVVTGRFKT
jgi:hypothetical protein